jgi:rhodanese-related sulfurtransferase
MKSLALICTAILALGLMTPAHADETVIDGMMEYLDFADYEAGIILPAQIDESVFQAISFIDTRDAGQFAAATIPGAINIEWREVLARRDEIPATGLVVLFCNTGTLSAQATFALRVAGHDNVVVLQTGFLGWQETAAYRP